MCGCEAHWKGDAPCTCSCPGHVLFTRALITNTANADSWHHHVTVSAGGMTKHYIDGQLVLPTERDDGPTEEEIARAIDSIRQAQEDEEES